MRTVFMIAIGVACTTGLTLRTVQAAGACCGQDSQATAPAAAKAAAIPTPGLATNATAVSPEEIPAGEWRGDDLFAYCSGEWALEIKYLNRGTRSEGQEGRLLKAGVAVAVGEQAVQTPIGLLRHYGSERRKPWDLTGWNFADRRKVRRSADLPVKSSTGPADEPAAATP